MLREGLTAGQAANYISSRGKTVRLPVVGQVKLREPLRFTGKVQSATVADRWFIAMAVEIPAREVQPPSREAVGIDLGLTTFAVLSNGPKVEAPKPRGKGLHKLRRLSAPIPASSEVRTIARKPLCVWRVVIGAWPI